MAGLITIGAVWIACDMSANKSAGGFFGALITVPLIVIGAYAALKALGLGLP